MSSSTPSSSQRSTMREDMGGYDAANANVEPAQDMQRSSAGSARSTSSRSRQNPQQQLSTIEKSVTHLLVATKQLLETLTMWSRGGATETEVSDVYVRLGYEFNIACRAFSAIGVETNDLGPVPDMLRSILEDTLSQEASQASLDKYLPRIRDIIINLLQGLKKKQQRLRQKGATSTRDGGSSDGRIPPRQTSVTSNASAETQLAQQLDDMPARTSSPRTLPEKQGSGDGPMPDLPPRTASIPGRMSPERAGVSPQNSIKNSGSRDTISTDSGSSLSSNAMQNIPVIAPYPEMVTIPTNEGYAQQDRSSPSGEPPRPPPKQNDALSALQKSGDLERRASRRFSSYQIQKHLGGTMNGIPPSQNSPIPNRGRDVRESLSAVRSRGSVMHSRARSRNQEAAANASPNRMTEVRRISEEPSDQEPLSIDTFKRPYGFDDQLVSPMVKTPEDKLASYPFPETAQSPSKFGATLNGPLSDPMYSEVATPIAETLSSEAPARSASRKAAKQHTPPPPQYVPEGSPQPGKELTLFLQYKSKIKKFVLPDGGDLSLARLQLAFIEKFAWSTQNNGADLPELYIQDPVSGVRHELEDLADVKERSVLVLNVEALDEVKRHIDEGIGGLRRIVESIRTSVEDQNVALKRVSDRQQETAKDLASIAAVPAPPPAPPSSLTGTRSVSSTDKTAQLSEVTKMRRDLAVVRQTYTSFVSDMNASMATIRSKAASVKKAAADATIPDMDSNSGRGYVNNGKKQLSDDSEKIVNRVDDLQDLVEDLRKDVVTRGVRPIPRQLESVSRDISVATSDLKKLQEFLKREKPVWTKIWEKELQVVCDDRDLLTLQEELAIDLEDDLEKAAATFALVEQATKQQNLHKPTEDLQQHQQQFNTGGFRSASGKPLALASAQGADPHKAKDSVLGEVRALQPNHDSRLEAIERAERARQKELEDRREGEFQKELGSFVEEGRLKKTGGVEEVERVRKLREEKARAEMRERQAQRLRDKAERDAAAANATSAAAAPAESGGEANVNGAAPPDVNGIGESSTGAEGESERASSPDPGFVDAKEEAGTPSTESGA